MENTENTEKKEKKEKKEKIEKIEKNERLGALLKRYGEVSLLIQDTDIVKDQRKYREAMREYTRLKEVADAYG